MLSAPQGWNIVNKNLFLPILIVRSYSKAPHGAPVCSVTILKYFCGKVIIFGSPKTTGRLVNW